MTAPISTPGDTYLNYLEGQSIAGGDFCSSESPSRIRFSSLAANVDILILLVKYSLPPDGGMGRNTNY